MKMVDRLKSLGEPDLLSRRLPRARGTMTASSLKGIPRNWEGSRLFREGTTYTSCPDNCATCSWMGCATCDDGLSTRRVCAMNRRRSQTARGQQATGACVRRGFVPFGKAACSGSVEYCAMCWSGDECTSCADGVVLKDSACHGLSDVARCTVDSVACTKYAFWHRPTLDGTGCETHAVWRVVLLAVEFCVVLVANLSSISLLVSFPSCGSSEWQRGVRRRASLR